MRVLTNGLGPEFRVVADMMNPPAQGTSNPGPRPLFIAVKRELGDAPCKNLEESPMLVSVKNVWFSDADPLCNGLGSSFRRKKEVVQEIKLLPMIVSVAETFREAKDYPSPLLFRTWPHNNNFVSLDETHIDVLNVSSDPSLQNSPAEFHQWLRAGPRKMIKFDPQKVVAAIVTCGGLCPGLNNVIREITTALHRTYNVKCVYGIQYGYKGFYSHEWKKLDLSVVRDIHKTGGTMLGTSRGGFDLDRCAIARCVIAAHVTAQFEWLNTFSA